jgi:serine/threonine protein kinase
MDERLGKWTIHREIGRGGMGQVFLAQEEITGRQAAIKVLAAELAQDPGFLHRFQREIDSLSQLDHPNIVRFFEAGCENGHFFYAMEYIEGQNLEDILKTMQRLPWPEVLDIACQVCQALRHVHDHGIIHRDLKPPNLLRTPTGQIKLTDFGIAKLFASRHLTATGGVVGTAEFLSPEQAAGKPVTKRSDLYSLGVVLYMLLTGRGPFEGETFVELLHKHRYAQFDRPQRLVPDLPHELDDLVCQLLEKDPSKRPPDCLVLGKQLESIRRKLDRKNFPTQALAPHLDTVAENLPDVAGEDLPGPATLMSRLIRAELEQQNRKGPVARFFNQAWVLSLLLVLCVSTIVWAFWPMSADSLYEHGAELMASANPRDWERAWRDYLEPLNNRFPDHPYQDQVARFKKQLDAARRADQATSEAERLFHQGELLEHEGRLQEARRLWVNLIQAFKEVESEGHWVAKSEQAVQELDRMAAAKDRWVTVRQALERARKLHADGRRADAECIWSALETLYRDDPWARDILAEIEKDRKE